MSGATFVPLTIGVIGAIVTFLGGLFTYLAKRSEDRNRFGIEGFDKLTARLENENVTLRHSQAERDADYQRRIEELERELQALRQRVEQLTAELDASRLRRKP